MKKRVTWTSFHVATLTALATVVMIAVVMVVMIATTNMEAMAKRMSFIVDENTTDFIVYGHSSTL
jgi:hypothetical protein